MNNTSVGNRRRADPKDILAFERDREQRAEERRKALISFMERHNLKPYPWARRAGVSESAIYAFLKGHSLSLSQKVVDALAQAAGTTSAEILGYSEGLPVNGIVAGGKIRPAQGDGREPTPAPGGDSVSITLESTDATVYQIPPGSRLLVADRRDPQDCLERLCVVKERDPLGFGEAYVGVLVAGSRPGFYEVWTMAGQAVQDIQVEWCAPVRWVQFPP